jgi:hypothetical protein
MENSKPHKDPSQDIGKTVHHFTRVLTSAVIAMIVAIGHRLIVEQMHQDFLNQRGSGWNPEMSSIGIYVFEFFLVFFICLCVLYIVRYIWKRERFSVSVLAVSVFAFAYLLLLWFSH